MTIEPTMGTNTVGLRRHTAWAVDSYGIIVPGGRIDGATPTPSLTDKVFVGKYVAPVAAASDWALFE